jgi:hypothetical protein
MFGEFVQAANPPNIICMYTVAPTGGAEPPPLRTQVHIYARILTLQQTLLYKLSTKDAAHSTFVQHGAAMGGWDSPPMNLSEADLSRDKGFACIFRRGGRRRKVGLAPCEK